MELRVRKQNENAAILAHALTAMPGIRAVYHPSLSTHPQHQLAKELLSGGFGAIISFRIRDELAAVDRFFRALRLVKYLGTLGGVCTSVTHPATAFCREFSPEALSEMGLTPGLIRISVGTEAPADLEAEFSRALAACADPL